MDSECSRCNQGGAGWPGGSRLQHGDDNDGGDKADDDGGGEDDEDGDNDESVDHQCNGNWGTLSARVAEILFTFVHLFVL